MRLTERLGLVEVDVLERLPDLVHQRVEVLELLAERSRTLGI